MTAKAITKQMTWTFKGVELYNDIADIAYLEGYIMKDDADPAKHSTQDIMAEGNRELVIRSLDKASAEAAELMHAYVSEVIEDQATADNSLTADFKDYTFKVHVPEHFSKTTQAKAVALVHDYLVHRALDEFLLIVNPEAAAKSHAKCDELSVELGKCMNKRTRPVRLTQFPA